MARPNQMLEGLDGLRASSPDTWAKEVQRIYASWQSISRTMPQRGQVVLGKLRVEAQERGLTLG